MQLRAKQYLPIVRKYSEKYDVYLPLIFSIMHTESDFNPKARSYAPAYGLMQLVPRSGARDAYQMVYGIDKILKASYLYNPENNIELGAAYLNILDKRYLKHIVNKTSRMYCAIAAYNTGVGNVSRAFTNGTSVKTAANVINELTSGQVYAKLRANLPYDETKNYVKKVCKRIEFYGDWE